VASGVDAPLLKFAHVLGRGAQAGVQTESFRSDQAVARGSYLSQVT
jgi:hypothetical protein